LAAQSFQFICTEQALANLASEVAKAQQEGKAEASYIDTEADSLHHYTEKLCLIQLAVAENFYLVDPLAIKDCMPLLRVLDEKPIWLHGADYDLSLFQKTYGWMPKVIRDTQIASRLTGHREFGLASLVQKHFGVVLSKASQKADWSQRPLPEKMQDYAVDDVRYLKPLVESLVSELKRLNRMSWFEQSCESLRNDVLSRTDRPKTDPWRVSGSGRLRPRGLAFLREAWSWRDEIAAQRDVPPFRVLNNQDILAMAFDFEEHGQIKVPHRWRPAWKDALQAIEARLNEADESTFPQRLRKGSHRFSDEERNQVESLCKLRDRKAEELGLENSVLGSRSTLEALVMPANEEVPGRLMKWQKEVLGL
jgi:ribonuclease D